MQSELCQNELRFEYDMPLEGTKHRCLSVSVKNSSSFRGPDIIGQVQEQCNEGKDK